MNRIRPVLVAVAVLAAASACGGDDTGGPADTTASPAADTAAADTAAPETGVPDTGVDDTVAPDPGEASDRPIIVVTYSVLGAVVADLVGEAAQVTVLMPDGVDPHEWEPSARDVETITDAALVISNGFALEESLVDILESEAAVHIEAGDFVTPRADVDTTDDDHDHGESSDDDHGHAEDPHFWMDPLAMRDVVTGLAPALADAGIDVTSRVDAVVADLEAVAAAVEATLAPLAPERRQLVTGHESLGWFADRFGFDLIGAVIPSFSSQAEPSAGDLAELTEAIERTGVPAIFTETGTPDSVVDVIADTTGVAVVEIATHDMPTDGRYRTFVLDIAERVVSGLSGEVDG